MVEIDYILRQIEMAKIAIIDLQADELIALGEERQRRLARAFESLDHAWCSATFANQAKAAA